MDKRDVICFFQEIRYLYPNMNLTENISKVTKLLDEYDICRLDIKRIYRYLDKNISLEDKTNMDI